MEDFVQKCTRVSHYIKETSNTNVVSYLSCMTKASLSCYVLNRSWRIAGGNYFNQM